MLTAMPISVTSQSGTKLTKLWKSRSPVLHYDLCRRQPFEFTSVLSPLVTTKMSRPIAESIEDGQFDDAPEDTVETPNAASQVVNLREEHNYIDDENILEWSEDSSDEEEDTFDLEEDQMEAEAFESLRAEDEDWEIAERGM